MKLTIAIPTYNRPRQLLRCLRHLVPQLTAEVDIAVFDNCSAESIMEVVKQEFGRIPEQVTIHRNAVNIGGCANIMRCFEYCATDYLWPVGDDDVPAPTAVETILRDIRLHTPVTLTYAIVGEPSTTKKANEVVFGAEAFLANFTNLGCLTLISSNVYSVSCTKSLLRFGYKYSYSLMPHLMIALLALKESEPAYVSSAAIVERTKPDPSELYSMLGFFIAFTSALDCPISHEARRELKRLLEPRLFGWPGLLGAISESYAHWATTRDDRLLRFRLRQLHLRWVSECGGVLSKATVILSRLASITPGLTLFLVKVLLRSRNRDLSSFSTEQALDKRTL